MAQKTDHTTIGPHSNTGTDYALVATAAAAALLALAYLILI
jgi:hypothetical protein